MKHTLLLVFLFLSFTTWAQNCSLKGIVTTTDGQAAAGVTVSIGSLKMYT
ncbi:MAG: hypothetical protein H7068_10005, partial [Pedobacter sp.]|nr:hypothetical protein [Chitinophagaceae bacterium]